MKKRTKQKVFTNKEIDIQKLKKDYEKIQRMEQKRLSQSR